MDFDAELQLLIIIVDKKPIRCHFCVILYLYFTSRSTCFWIWRLCSVIATCWCAVTVSGVIQMCLSVWVDVFYVCLVYGKCSVSGPCVVTWGVVGGGPIIVCRCVSVCKQIIQNELRCTVNHTLGLLIISYVLFKYWRKNWEKNEAVLQLSIEFRNGHDSYRRLVLHSFLILWIKSSVDFG